MNLLAEIRRMGHWIGDAACNADQTHLFFPETDGNSKLRAELEARAKLVCASCPVLERCREYALTHNVFGVWGGLTYKDRRGSTKSEPTVRSAICGTVSGYKAHWRAGEVACWECRKANSRAKADWRKRKKA